jgi:hypothetical protein
MQGRAQPLILALAGGILPAKGVLQLLGNLRPQTHPQVTIHMNCLKRTLHSYGRVTVWRLRSELEV